MSSPGPGQVLFAFVRHWSRRSWTSDDTLAEHGRLVLVVEAVQSLSGRGMVATVNAIAHELRLDQSGASRLIKSATEAGYLSLHASDTDGRERHVTLTSSGHTLLEGAHDWQEQVFDRLTDGWSEQRRRDVHQAMMDLIDRSYALDAYAAPRRQAVR